jgi:hypothetical protein
MKELNISPYKPNTPLVVSLFVCACSMLASAFGWPPFISSKRKVVRVRFTLHRLQFDLAEL